jgi:hypothetical protein
MDVVSDELDPIVGVVARRQKHFKRADKIFQYLRMAPRGSCRPSREGVARDGVLVPEPGPARGDHAVNRQQGFDGLQLERLTFAFGARPITPQMATISECRYRWLRVPATKIDTENQAISMDCLVFVLGSNGRPNKSMTWFRRFKSLATNCGMRIGSWLDIRCRCLNSAPILTSVTSHRKPVEIHGTAATMSVPISSATM